MGAEFEAEITCDGVGSAIHDGGMSATRARHRPIRADAARRRLRRRRARGAEAVAGPVAHHRPRHPGGVRVLGLRAVADRRLVPQPVLVRARARSAICRCAWVSTARWCWSTGRPERSRSSSRRGRRPRNRPTWSTPSGLSPPPAAPCRAGRARRHRPAALTGPIGDGRGPRARPRLSGAGLLHEADRIHRGRLRQRLADDTSSGSRRCSCGSVWSSPSSVCIRPLVTRMPRSAPLNR